MATEGAKKKLSTEPSSDSAELPVDKDFLADKLSFTAKEQHEYLEAAFANSPVGDDEIVVPVSPISNPSSGITSTAYTNPFFNWRAWAEENSLTKSMVVKSIAASLVAVVIGWMPLQRLFATTSAEAVTNAHVIILRAPIDGEVSAQAAHLELGKSVRAGDELLTVNNPRSDSTLVDNLKRAKQELTTTISVLKEKKRVLEVHRSELAAQKERYRTSRVEQLQKRISEIEAGIASARAQHEVTAKALARARELYAKGTVAEALVEKAARDESVALEATNAQLERLKATQVELAAAQQGTFVSDGYNDTSESAQRGLEVELQLAEVKTRLAGAIEALADIDLQIDRETKRYEALTTAVILSNISGRVWDVMTAPGEHVNAGQELVRLLDCSNTTVTASVTQTVYEKLRIGQPATFRPSDRGTEAKGWIVGLSGLAAIASNDAIQPKALSGAPYHVTLRFPTLDDKESCQVSRPGLVTFNTSNKPANYKVSDAE